MPNKLTIAFLGGALAFAAFPAVAIDLPDYGSKNFSPSGDTPSYFTNETAPVSARTADATASDWSAVDTIAPASSAAASAPALHTSAVRQDKSASTARSGRHTLGKARGSAHATGAAKANAARAAGTASQHSAAVPPRSASRRPAWAAGPRASVKSGPVGAANATSVKRGKTNPRHAGAAARYSAASLSDADAVPEKA